LEFFFNFSKKFPNFYMKKEGITLFQKACHHFLFFSHDSHWVFCRYSLGITGIVFFNKNNGGFFPMLGHYQVWSVRIVWLILVSKN